MSWALASVAWSPSSWHWTRRVGAQLGTQGTDAQGGMLAATLWFLELCSSWAESDRR